MPRAEKNCSYNWNRIEEALEEKQRNEGKNIS
jgi:hypothetical protein